MKNLFTLAATSFVAFTGLVSADYDDAQLRNLENRITCLEQKRCTGMINPAARPVVDDGIDLFITGDFLYWKTHENGLAYVITNQRAATSNATSPPTLSGGKVKNVKHDYDAGFRVGAGFNLPHDGWDIYLNWTRFTTHENDQVNAPLSGGSLVATMLNPAVYPNTGTLSQANSRWKLKLNVADLELGREFYISKYLTLRPFAGLRSAWIRQKMNVDYNYVSPASVLTVINPSMKSHFWGMGLRTGLDTQWGFGSGWSLYADGAVSLLYGYYDITQSEYSRTGTAVSTTMNAANHPRIGRAITDLAAGLRWEESFSCDSFRLRIQGGWEQHMYFGQNQYMKFADSLDQGLFVSNQGDVSFEGWTLSAQLDF